MTNKPRSDRRLRVRGVRRSKPDMGKLSRALIMLAQSQAEKAAEIEHKRPTKRRSPESRS